MKKNILFISLSLGILITLGIGFSYSLWNISVSQDNINVATTKCFNVEITSQKNSISLENAYPISNEKGKKLTPFSFTVTNTCDIFASYTINLESLKDTTLSSKFINTMINNEEIKRLSDYETTDTVNTGSIESHTLAKGSLGSGDSEDYTLRVWIDYDTTIEDLDNETKTFKSKIVVKAQPSSWNPVDEGYTTLHDAILANEYQTTPEAAIKKIEAKGTPDFSETAPIIIWQEEIVNKNETMVLDKPSPAIINTDSATYSLTINDSYVNLATSYYFDKETGYYTLKNFETVDPTAIDFSQKDYYYILEYTNYNGYSQKLESVKETRQPFLLKVISATKKNSFKSWNNKTYDSITYSLTGERYSIKSNENDKSDKGLYSINDDYGTSYYYRGAVANNNVVFNNMNWKILRINRDNSIRLILSNDIGKYGFNSNYNAPAYGGYMYGADISNYANSIKNEVNSTAKETLDNWYIKYFSGNNINKYIADAGFCNDRSIVSGDGFSTNKQTNFSAYNRNLNNTATLICPQADNDLFTTVNSSIGNKALTYPIGLITADELLLAGANRSKINRQFFLAYETYWTISPSYYNKTYSCVTNLHYITDGYIHNSHCVDSTYYLKPVISLKPDVKISGGIGTINEPFVVKTE